MPVTNSDSPSPVFQINDVDVAIYLGEGAEAGGIIEQWSDRGLEVLVYFHCRWSDRIELIRGLRGTVALVGNTVIRDILPFHLPQDPLQPQTKWNRWICTGTDNFIPKKFRTDQDGEFTGLAGWGYYDSVVVPAHFMVTTYFTDLGSQFEDGQVDPSGFPFTTTKIRVSGEIFSPPSQVYKFKTADANGNFIRVEDIGVGITRVRAELDVMRHYMPVVPLANLQVAMGKLNESPMKFADFNYPKGSILCSGVQQSDPYGDAASGLIVQDYEYTLIANGESNNPDDPPLDWNLYMRPDNGLWDQLLDPNGRTPFRYADLSHLIWPEYV
jgi:hypothetical protein